ncbi:MAG: hypothetical protein EU539_04455 [Promethearchaeota archaeon]|nr:MAG: hypothetical protein EU539_04455 [Candidatus Lokiarchaeota archaeon]
MDYHEYNRRGRKKREDKTRKSQYEKMRTHQEVKQIKSDLINYAQTSWGKHWIHSILKIGRPFRMQRGIEYAKDEERIENVRINKGQIFATVQGTAPTPYRVKINFDQIPEVAWNEILEDLSKKALNLVQLLDGKLPEEIIIIFKKNNYNLFPDSTRGLEAECSCPDQEVPCKHIAAVILYIAKVLDYDPFILLKLRGKTKKEILRELGLSYVPDKKLERAEAEMKSDKDQNIEYTFNVPKISIKEIISKQKNKDLSSMLTEMEFKFKKPGKLIEILANLGMPPNLDNPKAFKIVLESLYSTIMDEVYSMSTEFEKT